MNEKDSSITGEDLHAYVDGVLVEHRREDVERLLGRNADIAARVDCYQSLNRILHAHYDLVLFEAIPARLKLSAKRRWFGAANMRRFAAMTAALVLGMVIGIGGSMERLSLNAVAGDDAARLVAADGRDGFARESAIAHVTYAPDVERPAKADSDSPREGGLGKWLSARLGTDVVPPELTHAGYKLMGGRLLPDGRGTFAQFTYNDAKGERITVCVSHRMEHVPTTGLTLYRDGPVKVFHWTVGDYGYSVTGGISRDALLEVAREVKSAMTADGDVPTTRWRTPQSSIDRTQAANAPLRLTESRQAASMGADERGESL